MTMVVIVQKEDGTETGCHELVGGVAVRLVVGVLRS